MDAKQRRAELLRMLQMDIKAMSATNIGEKFGVSRQIIVGDIALLRAAGHDIVATQSGYILAKKTVADERADEDSYILACRHDKTMLENELHTIVDNGGILVGISIDHPLYGNISLPMDIRSRYDADAFISKVAMTGSALLSSLTDGAHLHTIRCNTPEAYRRILAGLREAGILYTK